MVLEMKFNSNQRANNPSYKLPESFLHRQPYTQLSNMSGRAMNNIIHMYVCMYV